MCLTFQCVCVHFQFAFSNAKYPEKGYSLPSSSFPDCRFVPWSLLAFPLGYSRLFLIFPCQRTRQLCFCTNKPTICCYPWKRQSKANKALVSTRGAKCLFFASAARLLQSVSLYATLAWTLGRGLKMGPSRLGPFGKSVLSAHHGVVICHCPSSPVAVCVQI